MLLFIIRAEYRNQDQTSLLKRRIILVYLSSACSKGPVLVDFYPSTENAEVIAKSPYTSYLSKHYVGRHQYV